MLKGEYIIAIIGNAVNGLIVGIFTYLGVKTTIKFEKKKYENERKDILKKEQIIYPDYTFKNIGYDDYKDYIKMNT